jgi:hypothetical protein
LIAAIGALQQAPRHSTSSQLNLPSAETWFFGPIFFFRTSISEPDHAGRGTAELHERNLTDRLQLEHGVEGGHLQHADDRHLQHPGDQLDGRLADPAFLLLGQPQQRDGGRLLAGGRVLAEPEIDVLHRLFREGEAVGLVFGEAADGHERIFQRYGDG